MGVVFGVLVALMIASTIMSRLDTSNPFANLFRRDSESEDKEPAPEPVATVASQSGPTGQEVAAIAVAIALSRAESATQMVAPAARGAGLSPWTAAGRRQAMNRPSRVTR